MSTPAREDYLVTDEPYYRPVQDEVERYEAAYGVRMPVMLKGPTGCGKSRFVEYMAWKLKKPLITVACNEDMTAADLIGRFLLDINGTRWQDGPKKGEVIDAHPDFQIVISYNPGYQSMMKDLKQSTKQRFGAMSFDYPEAEVEAEIVAHESGVAPEIAAKLVQVAQSSRNLKGHGLDEGMSTRLLIYAGQLIEKGIAPAAACRMALVEPITDDPDMRETLDAAASISTAPWPRTWPPMSATPKCPSPPARWPRPRNT